MSNIRQFEDLLETSAAKEILASQSSRPWPPLPEKIKPVNFPLSSLPPIGRDFAEAEAEALQIHPDMAACFLLGALSTACVGKGSIKLRPGYSEPLQLYVAVVAKPSERKSSAVARIFNPIHGHESAVNDELRPEIRDARAKIGMKKKQLEAAQKKSQESAVLSIAREIEALEEIKPYELIIAEGTMEAIMERMAENNGRITVVSAEGSLLDIMAGMYSDSKVNLDPILQGYSGEPINIARINRRSKRIERANLSITLAIQPVSMEELFRNEILARRGVVSRFLFSYPPTTLGKRDSVNAAPVPHEVSCRYHQRMNQILKLPAIDLSLSPEALDVFNTWDASVESMIGPDQELDRLPSGWGGKILGNTARIAGLLSLLDNQETTVQAYTMRAAVDIAKYFISQLTAIAGTNIQVSSEAGEVLNYIARAGQPEFAPSVLKQSLRSRKRFSKAETVDTALHELVCEGLIRPMPAGAYSGNGRPPQPKYQMHPGLLDGCGGSSTDASM